MTNNVISIEDFQKARAPAISQEPNDRATELYILAHTVSRTQAHVAAATLDTNLVAEAYVLALPDKEYDCLIRATTALAEAVRLIALAADNLERAGRSQERIAGSRESVVVEDDDAPPDMPA